MTDKPIEHLIILGGGTAGWMAAATLGKLFKNTALKITLIESSQIATVGVGEATIPHILNFHAMLGIDEREFLKFTQGTFKLGIEFVNWAAPGQDYMHPFGRYGTALGPVPFYHHWQKLNSLGLAKPLPEYSLNILMAYQNKFTHPVNLPNSPLRDIHYAYHFDARLYAQFLKDLAIKSNVHHHDAKVKGVITHPSTGFIQSLCLDDGQVLDGDFFIDCSGFRAVLIEQALHTGFDDWSHLLPCNRAVTLASAPLNPLPAYTTSTAQNAGWQWRIPLQHRTGNGYVYSNHFISDQDAQATLQAHIPEPMVSEPHWLKFTTGVRRKAWNKNCLALGLAAGFLEPLESTSIHLVHDALANFLNLFPTQNPAPALINQFNKLHLNSFHQVRDLLILHYWANQRDGDFWRHCRTIELPDRLKHKIELYQTTGRLFREDNELFNETSWLSVLLGQGISTTQYSPMANIMPVNDIQKRMEEVLQVIQQSAQSAPSHADFIRHYCAS